MHDDPERPMTVEEAATYLRVDHVTVQRELKAGRLPGAKVGRAWRVNRVALDLYLHGQPDPYFGMKRALMSLNVEDTDGAIRALMGGAAHASVPEGVRADLLQRIATLDKAVGLKDAALAKSAAYRRGDSEVTLSYVGRSTGGSVNLSREWNRVVDETAMLLQRQRAEGRQ